MDVTACTFSGFTTSTATGDLGFGRIDKSSVEIEPGPCSRPGALVETFPGKRISAFAGAVFGIDTWLGFAYFDIVFARAKVSRSNGVVVCVDFAFFWEGRSDIHCGCGLAC